MGIKGVPESVAQDGSQLRVGIVHARWNRPIIDALLQGCIAKLGELGVKQDNIVVQTVPGSFELPFACSRMIAASQIQSNTVSTAQDLLSTSPNLLDSSGASPKGIFDAVIAVGVLIKGSTMHFEYICDSVTHALMKTQMDTGVPVIFGVLTALTEDQALERAGIGRDDKGHNHGIDWAAAAVEMGLNNALWGKGKFH